MTVREPAHLGEVAAPGGKRPTLDASMACERALRIDERQLLGSTLCARETVATQVVCAALQQRDARRPPERCTHQRQVLGEQLVLERTRSGGDQNARAREQRRHQIGKGLARASARLDHQRLARGERRAHALRHAQLLAPHLEVRERPRERAVAAENVLKIQHVARSLPLRLWRILARLLRSCRGTYLHEFAANWCASRCWHTMAAARVLYQGAGATRDIIRSLRSATEREERGMATAAHTMRPLPQVSPAVSEWVNSVRELTQPRAIHWCEGTDAEARELTALLLSRGELKSLNAEQFPGCQLYRSAPNDVARVEHLTYICTSSQEDAGPNTHWMDPQQAHARMREFFRGCMRERTMYVIPYCMGPIDSPLSRCGVEITDSPYVVINMLIMTRAGRAALERIAREDGFVRGLHSIGELDPERRFIMHFPEELAIESYGSGYGGNALLGKKRVRCASRAGRRARRAGSPSTCPDRRAAEPSRRHTTSPAPSPPPAARPISPC